MTEGFLKELKGMEVSSLTAKDAIELRGALQEALELLDSWFANLAEVFERAVKDGRLEGGRPPVESGNPSALSPPVKPQASRRTPARKRGRPVPEIEVKFNRSEPLAVGGADAENPQPQAAQIFQDSYVSKDGPRPGAALPADHPRRQRVLESSVTPETDLSDFAEVEEAYRRGDLKKVFQAG